LSCSGILHGINRKFWADDLAEVAVDTIAFVHGLRRVVALLVKPVGELKHLFGAELYTVAASLAAVFQDMNDPLRGLNGL